MSPLFLIIPFGLGGTELFIIGIVAVLLFGGRLPAMARNFGRAIPEFKAGLSGINNEADEVKKDLDKAASQITSAVKGS